MKPKKTVGSCFHLINDFICSEGKYQNYPCPYRNSTNKCPCFAAITKEMVESWDRCGYMQMPVKEV